MAFVMKEWKDRIAEFAGRRRLTDVDTGTEMVVDVERDEGFVSQTGDMFSAQNMNDLEQRINTAFGGLSFVVCTQADFDAIGNGRPADTLYIIRG